MPVRSPNCVSLKERSRLMFCNIKPSARTSTLLNEISSNKTSSRRFLFGTSSSHATEAQIPVHGIGKADSFAILIENDQSPGRHRQLIHGGRAPDARGNGFELMRRLAESAHRIQEHSMRRRAHIDLAPR